MIKAMIRKPVMLREKKSVINDVSVKLNKCFGISSFEHKFDFSKTDIILLYAPNGVMKTSFANTFKYIAEGKRKEIKDRVSGEMGTAEVRINGSPLDGKKHNNIYIVNGDEFLDAGESVSTFLVEKSSRERVEKAMTGIRSAYSSLMSALADISGDKNAERDITRAFASEDVYELLADESLSNACSIPNVIFPYDSICDVKGKIDAFVSQNKVALEQYAKAWRRIISKSKLFGRAQDGSVFDSTKCLALQNSLGGGEFFKVGHALLLKDKGIKPIVSVSQLELLYESELKRLAKDKTVRQQRAALTKKLASNAELRRFNDVLLGNPWLCERLDDICALRKDVWRLYLKQAGNAHKDYCKCFAKYRQELIAAREKAMTHLDTWKDVVSEFKDRFVVPFDVEIENEQEMIVDAQKPARLIFSYDAGTNRRRLASDELQRVLSRGEARAMRLMQVIFELKSRGLKDDDSGQLLIFDDVVDSFDYRNKYAMVEYLHDIVVNRNPARFKCIVLTHNFDFYRLVATRLDINRADSTFMVAKTNQGLIVQAGEYQRDVLKNWLGRSDFTMCIFLAMIPFVRNLADYTLGVDSKEYKILTACLHDKVRCWDASEFRIKDIAEAFARILPGKDVTKRIEAFKKRVGKYQDALFKEAKYQSSLNGDEHLERKLVLAMAIRLRVEQYLWKTLKSLPTRPFEKNQTGELIKRFFANATKTELQEKGGVLRKVSTVMPEYIHVNAFMYESLVDTSADILQGLYKEVSGWESKEEK